MAQAGSDFDVLRDDLAALKKQMADMVRHGATAARHSAEDMKDLPERGAESAARPGAGIAAGKRRHRVHCRFDYLAPAPLGLPMESLLRLALIAGTGASIGGLQRAGRRVAVCLAVALAIGAVGAAAVACFAAAGWYALLPQLGPAWTSVIIGLALALVAALIWAVAERRRRRVALRGSGLMDALPSQLPDIDVAGLLERNAGTIMLAAFAAGMFLNRRR